MGMLLTPRGRGAALLLLLVVMVCGKLVYLQSWLQDNDNYGTLGTFHASAGHHDYIRAAATFRDRLREACAAGDVSCRASADMMFGDQTYARPITAWFGSHLVDREVLSSAASFVRGIVRATVGLVAASALLTAALLVCFLLALPPAIAAPLAALLALFGVVGYFLPEQAAFGKFQPLLGVGALGAVGFAAVAAAAAWLSRTRAQRWLPDADRLTTLCWRVALALVVARVAAYYFRPLYFWLTVPGADVGVLMVLLSLIGLIVFVAALGGAARLTGAPPRQQFAVVVLLFALVSVGENFFSTAFHIAPRGNIFLLAAPILIYAALRPNGVVLWLLPALALYHVAIAALLYGCVLAAEIAAAARARRLSVAAVLATLLAAAAVAHVGLTGSNPLIAPQAMSAASVVDRIDWLAALPALAVLAVLGGVAVVVWRIPDPAGDFLLRATVLAMVLAVAGQLRAALEAAGVGMMDAAAFSFILLSYYLAPAVCASAIFLVVFAAARPFRGADRLTIDARALSLVAAGVLALAAARGGNWVGRPANPLTAISGGAYLALSLEPPATLNPAIVASASPDDRYLAGPSPGHAITMASILKLKARAAAGLLDAERVVIVLPPLP